MASSGAFTLFYNNWGKYVIFPVAECEREVRVGDKTRLLGVKSYATRGEERIIKVEICPDFQTDVETQPFTFNANGFFESDGSRVSQIDNADLSQIQAGMTITCDGFEPGINAFVANVDQLNGQIDISGGSMANGSGTYNFTITGEAEQPVESTFVDVGAQDERDYYLDWAYEGSTRDVTMAVRVTSDTASRIATKKIRVLSVEDDEAFSSDDDLMALEPNLTRFVPDGRATFINVHREAKRKILEALGDEGIRNEDGSALTPAVLKYKDEVRSWSRDLALSIIYQSSINETGDAFDAKAQYYRVAAASRKDNAFITLATPAKDQSDPFRPSQMGTVDLCR